MPDCADVRGWLRDPSPTRALEFAQDDDGDSWTRTTYTEVADSSLRVGGVLRRAGVANTDVVAVVMPTGLDCAATFFGVLALGAALTPVAPPMFVGRDQFVSHLSDVLTAAGATFVVVSAEYADHARDAVAACAEPLTVLVLDAQEVADTEPLTALAEPGPYALVQMTSGSTSSPRGVRVTWANLAANLTAIADLTQWRDGDRGISWLPLYHDMGLVGVFFGTVAAQCDLKLMRPDQFIRRPGRWVREMADATISAAPPFALGYAAKRLTPADSARSSRLRILVLGAEPLDPHGLAEFTRVTGLHESVYAASYGLAEATLLVTHRIAGEPLALVRVDNTALRPGEPVPVLRRSTFASEDTLKGNGWLCSSGRVVADHQLRIEMPDGTEAPPGVLGEIIVSGASVASGYSGEDQHTAVIDGRVLRTGDSGFLLDGQLFVLGRMGTSLKANGRAVFMEDVDAALAAETSIPRGALTSVAVTDPGATGIAVFCEYAGAPSTWVPAARRVVQSRLAQGQQYWLIAGPRGMITRTTSGKPRRAALWRAFADGVLTGASVLAGGEPPWRPSLPRDKVVALLAAVREQTHVPANATILLEGSLAEGFGNDGSDVDFLAVLPGPDDAPMMPSVLFVGDRRVEIRSQSANQIRQRLGAIAENLTNPGAVSEDQLNRAQRLLNATVIDRGPDWDGFTDLLTYRQLTGYLATWWRARAASSLRLAATLTALGASRDARLWACDGLTQALKGWLAERGEGYIETKWLPAQLDRAGDEVLTDQYYAADTEGDVTAICALAATVGAVEVTADLSRVSLRRVPGVTTWPIGEVLHVVRGTDLLALPPRIGADWRQVVFGRAVSSLTVTPESVAQFIDHGLVAVAYDGISVTAAQAMCSAASPLRPPPSGEFPLVTLSGARPSSRIARMPLSAKEFTECGLTLVWANVVLENAREDYAGAVSRGQWHVATIALRRQVTMALRALASAAGWTPLPADAVLERRAADLTEDPRVAEVAADLARIRLTGEADRECAEERVAAFVDAVRQLCGAGAFPSSFGSNAQWRSTLRIGYQWLRIGGYLNADLPLDEARDLFDSGGVQPHIAAASPPNSTPPKQKAGHL